jgi:HNH endonuclease
MKTIPLTKDQVALVDDADFEYLSQYSWRAAWNPNTSSFYAVRGHQIVCMHRELLLGLKTGRDVQVDHKNHDTLDNRRENLRLVTNSQNMQNKRKRASGSSKYKGVVWRKKKRTWWARINIGGGRNVSLGTYKDETLAARAYDRAAVQHFGEFACTNEMLGLLEPEVFAEHSGLSSPLGPTDAGSGGGSIDPELPAGLIRPPHSAAERNRVKRVA